MRSASGALRPPTPRDPDTPHLVGRGYAPDAPRRIFRDGIANQAPDQEPSGRSDEPTAGPRSVMRVPSAVFRLTQEQATRTLVGRAHDRAPLRPSFQDGTAQQAPAQKTTRNSEA